MINNEIRGTISGTVIQAREIHGSVYVHPAVDRTRFHPRQLPAPPLAYVQRPIEEQIQIAIDQAHAAHTSALVVLTGPTGVGKSSVAAWFLRRRPWLGEDGDLYVDLRGFSASPPADPRETLEWLLYCVGLDPRSMPPDLPSRVAWWRSKTAGRRLVLLMDDARAVGQVRPLLMGMGRHTIVVTSRALLTALRMDGAVIVRVTPLDVEDSVQLLHRLSGDEEDLDPAEQEAMRYVAAMCGGLPVALCVVAIAKSDESRRSWSQIAEELRTAQSRLSQLTNLSERTGADMSLRAAFDLSYESLPPELARTYRRLAWHPGIEITPFIASCLTGGNLVESKDALRDLKHHHLMIEHSPERYRFTDLVHDHALEKATELEGPEARKEAVAKLVRAFADLSVAADMALRPYVTSRTAETEATFTGAEAARWLDTEKGNLVDLIDLAAQQGLPQEILRLIEGLWPLFLDHGQARLWLRAGKLAIPAARGLKDERTLGRLLNKRSLVRSRIGRIEGAMADLDVAEEIWSRKKDWKRVAQTRQRRGILAFEHGDFQEAVDFLYEALAADEHTGAEHHRGVTLFMLGRAHLATDLPGKALECLEQALPLLGNSTRNQGLVRIALGSALLALGRPDKARCEVGTALTEVRECGAGHAEGQAWAVLGEIHEHQGDMNEAMDAYEKALELFTETEDERSRSSVQRRMARLKETR